MRTEKKNNITAYSFLFPAIVLFALFNLIPIGYSLYLSFMKWDGFSVEKKFVAFDNYIKILGNGAFYNSLFITAAYTIIVTAGSIALGLIVANLLNREIRMKTLFRTAYFIPVVTATAAAGVVWKYMLDPAQGIVNKFLEYIHLQGIPWLTDPFWVVISISMVGIWKRIGFNMIIYLAAMQTIPVSLYESAELDGATKLEKLWYITVPMLNPTTTLLVIMSFIDSFQVFDQVYVMTGGGPMGASEVLGLLMYRAGFVMSNLGYASAIGWVIFLFIFSATIIQMTLGKKEVEA